MLCTFNTLYECTYWSLIMLNLNKKKEVHDNCCFAPFAGWDSCQPYLQGAGCQPGEWETDGGVWEACQWGKKLLWPNPHTLSLSCASSEATPSCSSCLNPCLLFSKLLNHLDSLGMCAILMQMLDKWALAKTLEMIHLVIPYLSLLHQKVWQLNYLLFWKLFKLLIFLPFKFSKYSLKPSIRFSSISF